MMDEMGLTGLRVTFTDGTTRNFEEGRLLANGWLVTDGEKKMELFPPTAITKVVADQE